MPRQTPSASDYTKVVGASAIANAATANAASGFVPKGASSVPVTSTGVIGAIVTRSAVAVSSGLQPIAARKVTAPAPVPVSTVPSIALTNSGSDTFVTRYTSSGGLVWATRIGASDTDYRRGIAFDSAGNVYTAGTFSASPAGIFNSDNSSFASLTNGGNSDVYIVKYNSSGIVQWTARIGGMAQDMGYRMTADSAGNVYVIGHYYSAPVTVYHAGGGQFTTLTNSGAADVFIVKYNTSGTAQWAAIISGPGYDFGNGIAVDSSGNVYVGGYYGYYGGGQVFTINHANNGGAFTTYTSDGTGTYNGFIAKYNSSGTAQWAARISTSDQCYPQGIAVDSSGNVYMVGQNTSTLNVYNASGPSFGTLSNSGSFDGFIIKYNTSGAVQWTNRIAGLTDESIMGIGTDSAGNVYVSGHYSSTSSIIYNAGGSSSFGTLSNAGSNDICIVKYNSSGVAQWATRIGDTGNDVNHAICVDNDGNCYVTGYYASSPVKIYSVGGASITLANAGNNDVYIVKYNTSGIVQWAARGSGTLADQGGAIATDGTSVYINGYFSSTALTLYSQGL